MGKEKGGGDGARKGLTMVEKARHLTDCILEELNVPKRPRRGRRKLVDERKTAWKDESKKKLTITVPFS